MARSSWTALALVLASQLALLTRTILAAPPEHGRPVFNHSMAAPSFVYCLVPGQFGVTPEMFRARGGIQLLPDSIYTPISTNPRRTIRGLYRHPLGWRLYRIAASPNMIPRGGGESHGYSHSAVGGIPWTQVQAVTYFAEGTNYLPDLTWVANAEYDARWEGFGLGSHQPLLSVHPYVPEDRDMRAFAMAFMDSLVGEENSGLEAERRALLDELLGWTLRREFPVFVPGEAPSQPSTILGRVDWRRVRIPAELQQLLATGLANAATCAAAMLALDKTKRRPPRRRHVESSISTLVTLVLRWT
ncbi:hypothetical protein CDD80_6431 [Ophiocordyceps camponoti-rufipedis]|uniref:Enterotoxin n=1 Tax=Ophiocordyceps camponoti-rufipedis TaxID=2004952 RepID=A0A2C5ZM68_9HYPO|nr:hypothetical protein CDD80_6431 [Ophiocordyceps camponoti-rufipedis]